MASIADLEAVVTADTSDFDSKMAASGQKVDELGSKSTTAGANFGAASAVMAGGAAAIGVGIADAVMAAGDFQSSMNEIGAVTGATAEEMAGLSETALQVGMDTSFSAQQGAEAISELGKAGIPIQDIMDGAAMATADLAAAGGVDMPRAAEVMSNAMNSFGIAGEDAADVADTLAAASNASASDVNSLAMGLSQVAPSARGLGLSLEETVAQLALFSNYGMQGSDAGTSMKTMLASLTPSTKQAREAFAELGLSTAETSNVFFDAQGNFVGMEQASSLLYDALAPLTDAQRAAALETLFGSDASRAAEITFQAQKAAVEGTADGYSSLLDAVQPAGQATDVAEAKMAGMNGALEALAGSVETAQIAFGMAFLPVVEQVADKITDLVNVFLGLDPQIQTIISVVGAGAAAFLGIGSAIGFVIGPLGAFVGALAPVAAGVLAIAGPLALVVAGIAALYIAYQTNFLGFADGVNAALAGLTTAFGNFMLLIQNVATAFGEGGLGAALSVVGEAFATLAANLPGMLQGASDAILTWAQTQGTNILSGFNSIDWGSVGATLLSGIQTAIGAIVGLDALMTEKALQITQGLAQGVVDHWPDVVTAIQNGLTALGDAITAAAPVLVAAMQAGWTAIQDAVAPAWETIQTTISTAITTIQTTISDAMTAIQEAVSSAWITMQNDVSTRVTGIQDAITTAWEAIQTFMGEKVTAIGEAVTTGWTAIQTTIDTVMTAIQTTITTIWEALPTPVQTALTTIQTAVDTAWTAVQDTTSTALAALQSGISLAWEAMQTTITTALTTIQTAVSDSWNAIQTAVSDVLGTLQSGIATAFDAITTTVTTAGENIKTGFVTAITDMGTEALAALGGVKDSITGYFADAITWLAQAGADIVQGLINGITSMLPDLGGAIGSIGDTVGQIGIDLPGIGHVGGGGGGNNTPSPPPPSGGGHGGARAMGGPVTAGLSYWVGEHGPEPFIPAQSGRILSRSDAMAAMGGGGPSITIQTLNLPGVRDAQDFLEAMQDLMRQNSVATGRGVS